MINIDTFNSQFIDEYSKKILAFAYDKTCNICDAEDLSQEILVSLFTSIPKYSKIENMDSFVYTICYHCWSNFYRKNKKHWRNANIDDVNFMDLSDDCDVQEEVEDAVFIGKMKNEISYLSKLHRDIITMTYYDGKSSSQISKELNISDSTVRWHLVEIRKKLKGRIEMNNNENLNYKPIALKAFWAGQTFKTMRGIGQYRLVDNILYVCYGKALTIEEIAQKLSVAAAFIEQHINELVFMDDMKVVDGNKYQTNFFIRTREFLEIAEKYNYDNTKNKAERLYEAVEKRYGDIKAVNFIGSDFDKDFMLWTFIPMLISRLENKANNIIKQKKEYFYCTPKRKDGTEHWIRAFLQEDGYISSLPEEIKKFGAKLDYQASGMTTDEISSFQFISYATEQTGGRNIFWGDELQKIMHIAEIIKNNLTPDKYDKMLISTYAEAGLVKVDGDKIQMLIPCLKKIEYEKLDKILLEIESELGDDFFVGYIEGYMKKVKGQAPDFLPDNEKNYIATGITSIAAVPYYLTERGKLRYPTDEEAKRLGIIIWERK
ncbi:MAG: RNA polymerase sigma factor [Oscillospiraceae bacterium]|nr:RNA polymerase sigma factor [Oscillospiraceae bacterium]